MLRFLHHLSRGIRRRRHAFALHPFFDLSEADGAWMATGANPQFQLSPLNRGYPAGWVLFDTHLVRRSADCSARLLVDFGAGLEEGLILDIPSTRKGRVHELICLPQGVTGFRWAPQKGSGEIQHDEIVFTEVGTCERIYRMVRRIVPVLWRRPREKLEAAGLSLSRMIVDLIGAYRAAGNLRAFAPAPSYPEWMERFDRISIQDRDCIRQHIGRFHSHPRFVLVVAVPAGAARWLSGTLESIGRQLYRQFTVILVYPAGVDEEISDVRDWLSGLGVESHVIVSNPARSCQEQLSQFLMKSEAVDYVAMIQAGDVLTEQALYWMGSAIVSSSNVGLLYSDEDRLDAKSERVYPVFKPDWSPELLRSTNYIGQFAVYRSDLLRQAGGLTFNDCFGDSHDLLLRITDTLPDNRIAHIPAVLCHRHADRQSKSSDDPRFTNVGVSGIGAVEAHLMRKGIRASVTETLPGAYRTRYSLPEAVPMISLIIPTRDAFALIKRCIDSVLQRSTYSNYEILVVDNQSADTETLHYLQELRSHASIRVLSYDRPFNYSAINNYAASQAKGEVLCLLNNDTEVISPDWMEEMLGHLIQDRVGIVGAKLYYSDGRVQHAGDVVGVGGIANHLHAFIDRDSPGYCRRAVLAQDLSAVTGACLMTWRSLYDQLGGLDEENLPVAFNDVDYCLRIREAGYRVIWTPHAELYHHESVSRGSDDTPEKEARAKKEAAYMRSRWRHVMHHDPFYNPNLSYERPDFSLSHAPVVLKPWLSRSWR